MTIRPAYIKTSSGWVQIGDGNQTDLDGLVDVLISGSVQNNQALIYNSSASVWNNANIVNSVNGTENEINVSASIGNITLSLPNELITPGNLTVSGSVMVGEILNSNAIDLIISNDNAVALNTANNNAGISEDTGFTITTNGSAVPNVWIFNNNGNFTFPDATNQTTAFLGMTSYTTDDLDEGETNLYFTNERATDALTSTLSNYLTLTSASSTYLTQSDALSTYLTQSNALTTYLTQADASTTYLTSADAIETYATNESLEDYLTTIDASNLYLTQSTASASYQPIGSYLTSESDPVFTASESYNITSASTSAWNDAYGWGNHASAGYLTGNAEIDTLEDVTGRGSTSSNAITITNETDSTSATTGALIITGGVGIGGDMFVTGDINLSSDPTQSLHAATKQYVDEIAQGLSIKPSVHAATTENLSADYDNGTDGVGATLTATADGEWVGTDGVLTGWDVLNSILVKDQTNAEENGRYYISDYGSSTTPWVLTRCIYCDTSEEIPGSYIFVTDGDTYAGTGWVAVIDAPATFEIGTDDINYTQFSGAGTIVAGTNIEVDGNEVSVVDAPTFTGTVSAATLNLTNALTYQYGGTGLSSIGTAGQALKVNSTADGLEWGTVSGGGGSSAASVTSDPPESPEINQVWQDLDTGRIYVWNGDFWIEVQQNGSLGLLRYLGASSTAPVTSIDGSELQVGEVYFDTVFNGMKVYDGDSWEDAFSAASLSVSRWVKTAIGGETDLSGEDDSSLTLVYTPGIEEVYLNGVKLIRTSDYIASSGSMISNLEPLIAGSTVEVISYSGFTLANTYTKTEVDDLIQKQQARWTLVAGAGTSITTLSGSDDYSNILEYTPGTEQVFVNGILIVRGIDYTATDGSSVVLETALSPEDVVEVMGNSTFSVANTYTKAEVDAKLLNYQICTSSTKPASPTEGQMIYETDTNIVRIWDGDKWASYHRPGEIIESVSSICDGSVVSVTSGNYTVENVTTQLGMDNTYRDLTGSTIVYTPPPGATRVKYSFDFSSYWDGGAHAIAHYKFFIDGVEVVFARHNRSAQYQESRYTFNWTIPIGGTPNTNTGRQATWTTPKTLKMQGRAYSASANDNNLHGTVYWDGTGSNQFSMPLITIEAIA